MVISLGNEYLVYLLDVGDGLCVEPITRPEEFYRVCVVLCVAET